MWRYTLALFLSIALVILVAMGVVRYIEVFHPGIDIILAGHAIGPVTLILVAMVFAMFDGWRCTLVLQKYREAPHTAGFRG